MRPLLHPRLVNGRFGDPALFVEILHRRDALLFDCGDLAPLSPRDLLRIGHVFVSHMHMDHFIGFDQLLRVNVGRAKSIVLVGPEGIADAVGHKLAGYTWDLAERYADDLVFEVRELARPTTLALTRFRLSGRFRREPAGAMPCPDGVVAVEPGFRVTARVLAHHGPSLGFALAEPLHVNIWRTRLDERGLAPGPWLQDLKAAIRLDRPDETPIALPDGRLAPLGALRDLVSVGPGQTVAYVTDVADTPDNRAAIVALARGADTLFLESRFSAADRALADARAHLTTTAAGEIARAAGARIIEPFHFSPRYTDEEAMLAQVRSAFRGSMRPETEQIFREPRENLSHSTES